MTNKRDIENKIKKILEENKDVWKSESAFFSYIRGCVRLAWMKNPVKLKKLQSSKKLILNPNYGKPRNTRQHIYGATCEICKNDFPMKEVEVDHINGGNYSLRSIDDIQGFFESIVLVTDDDLRIVCKGCHGSLSYAAKEGISFERAVIMKQVIELVKTNKDVDKLKELGVVDIPTTKQKRRELLIDLLSR